MFKLAMAVAVNTVASCDCDARLSWPDVNCEALVSQGYDCSGCSICVKGYDSVSYQEDAWTESMNQIRALFNTGPLTWDQDIASDVYSYIKANEYPSGSIYFVDHSCTKYPKDPQYCSYSRPSPYGPSGENIIAGSDSCMWVPDLAMSWASESLNCKDTPCTQTTGTVGHFTAMVWAGAKTFGCGTTSHGVAMCRFKGDDTADCTTPNMGGCNTDNVNDWKYFTFASWCGSSLANNTISI